MVDLLLFLAFWLLAAIPALVGYRIASGPFHRRLRGWDVVAVRADQPVYATAEERGALAIEG